MEFQSFPKMHSVSDLHDDEHIVQQVKPKLGELPTYHISDCTLPDPKTSFRLTPLYKVLLGNQLNTWSIVWDSEKTCVTETFGIFGKELTTESYTSVSPVEFMKSRYIYQYCKEGYRPGGNKLRIVDKPMLAQTLELGKTRLRFPVAVQPKINGVRCLSRLQGDEVILRSRGDMKFTGLTQHFGKEIGKFLAYISVECELDGEIYYNNKPFSELLTIIRNGRHPEAQNLTYYVYDFICSDRIVMENRIAILSNALTAYENDGCERTRFVVLQSFPAMSLDEVLVYHAKFRALNFEGTIIRKLAGSKPTERHIQEALYKSDRSLNLIKHKDIQDDDFPIVECNETHITVKCIAQDTNGADVVTNIKFKVPGAKVGQYATIEYQAITHAGHLLNPKFKAIRDYE